MAPKRDFSESRERLGPQSPVKPINQKAENIDNLVSSFLAELTNLSSEVNQPVDQGATPGTPPETSKLPPHFKLQEDARSKAALDLERIDSEIEESLAELEKLKSAKPAANQGSTPERQPEPQTPVPASKAESSPETPAPSGSESADEQAWRKLELFRNSFALPERSPRRPASVWILAGLILIAVILLSAVYFFRSNDAAPGANKQIGMSEENRSSPALQPTGTRVEPPNPQMPAADLRKSNRSLEPAGPSAAEHSRSSPKSTSEAGNRSKTSGATAGSGPSARDLRNEASPKIRTAAEPVRQPVTQATPIPAIPDYSSVAASPESATPPKPASAAPEAQQNARGDSEPAVQTGAPAREIPAEAPKAAVQAEVAQPPSTPSKPREVQVAEIIQRVSPEYPVLARRQKVSGTVEVEVDVSEKGDVVIAKATSGPSLLRPAAEQALMKWRFKPASVGGVSVPSKAKVSVSFSLQ